MTTRLATIAWLWLRPRSLRALAFIASAAFAMYWDSKRVGRLDFVA